MRGLPSRLAWCRVRSSTEGAGEEKGLGRLGKSGLEEQEGPRLSGGARLEVFSKGERRRRAIDLRREGLELKEIEERLGYNDSAWVIGKWCRESGEIRSAREVFLTTAPPLQRKSQKGLGFRSAMFREFVRQTRRAPIRRREALCLYLQSIGIESHVYRLTNRYEVALYLLDSIFKKTDGCVPCEADYYLRCSHLYRSWKRWDESESALLESMNRYRKLPDCGHDLHGNGKANCRLSFSALRYFTVGPEAGAAEARKGLAMLKGGESPTLFTCLVVALANCLLPSKNPREVQKSEEMIDWCSKNLEIAKVRSVPRTIIYWLKGQLLALREKRDDAIEYLTLALDDAQFLKLELVVPPWCDKLEGKIRSLYDLSRNSRKEIDISVLSDLRKAAGGDRRMPSFIIPPTPSTAGQDWATSWINRWRQQDNG